MPDTWSPKEIERFRAFLTDRDFRILEDLEMYRALTTRQVQRLRFSAGAGGLHATQRTATRLANRVLLRLEAHGFIARLSRRVGGAERGSAGTTWHLAATGERLLRAQRGEPGRRRYMTPSHSFLAHTVAVAELAVQLRELERTGALEVLELQTEPNCWRPFQGSASTLTLKPDLFTVIANTDVEAHVFVELDRDTVHLPAAMKKCQTYQQYRQTGAEQARSGVYPAVLWVVPSFQRAEKLRAAIHQERDLPPELFTICEASEAVDVLQRFLDPSTPTRKEVSP